MEWLKPILPVLQTALKVYASGQFLKDSSENAKGVALRSSVLGLGGFTFFIFLIFSVLMVFVDLGHQLESADGVHFSGMMWSGLGLSVLGLLCFCSCFLVSKYLFSKEQKRKESAAIESPLQTSLILFVNELLEQLAANPPKEKSPENPL